VCRPFRNCATRWAAKLEADDDVNTRSWTEAALMLVREWGTACRRRPDEAGRCSRSRFNARSEQRRTRR
jgi:hypothetical protein